ncbi:MAG: RNB domain-containing ribonuclease [Actinobacteria bacterium]|nr:RNB domain-containing ribonuclease [Actinomycetota bacterium]MBS1888420.1 RNB domain-containing ribonuclease [Actinomycetota bacterium]
MTPGRGRRREAGPRRGRRERGAGARPGTLSRREEPKSARDAVADLLAERLGFRGFTGLVEEDAARAAAEAEASSAPRRDLTALATFTVDPATARDFDDAVSAQREGEAWRIWVHIADVAAHVRPGSPIDLEALRRANSTYVPGAVEPMLPHALSSGACSLSPGVERLAVTAEIELDAAARPTRTRFYRSRIRSDARLDYDQLDRVFDGREEPPAAVAEPLAAARDAAAGLGEHRGDTSLDVESAEPEFEFDAEGNVLAAHRVPQTEAHRLIERLMILTNERVAEFLVERRVPAVYRVHAQPDPPRVERLLEQLAALDLPTPPLGQGLSPRSAGEMAAAASRLARREAARRGHGQDAYTSLVLRSLKQAAYSEVNSGHAGLGSDAYTHFTSPIRRYPDLLVHRALLAALGEGEEAPTLAEAREVAAYSSAQERESARIERDADDVCAAYLLERELGERGLDAEFAGEVSGVIRAGAFVAFGGELGDVYEGMLPARTLPGGRYELDRAEVSLIGSGEGATALRLGDPVRVRVTGVDGGRGRVDLELTGGGGRR